MRAHRGHGHARAHRRRLEHHVRRSSRARSGGAAACGGGAAGAKEASPVSALVHQTFPNACGSEFGRSLIAPGGPYGVVEENVLGERMAVFEKRSTSILELLTN